MSFNLECRQCGKGLRLCEFGPTKICPNCGRITAPPDIKEVHITLGVNKEYPLEYMRMREDAKGYMSGIDYMSINLNYTLDIGDITNPPVSNSFAENHSYMSIEARKKVIRDRKKLLSLAPDTATLYIWIDEESANEYLNLLKFASLFEEFQNIYIIRLKTGECEDIKEMLLNGFSERQRLTPCELSDMKKEYRRLVRCGGDCRYGRYRDIHTIRYEELEGLVLSKLTYNSFTSFQRLYSRVANSFKKSKGYILSYSIVKEIVWRLLTKGVIKSKGPCLWWDSDNGHNAEIPTQSFSRCEKENTSSNEDIINLLHDALKYGYTQALYSILADDAVFVFEKREIAGKERIISAIEDFGITRIYLHGEILNVYILDDDRQEDRVEYYIGLASESGGRVSKFYYICVVIKDLSITKMYTFCPQRRDE